MTKRKVPRWTKRIALGLDLIWGYMDNELNVGEWSAIECRAPLLEGTDEREECGDRCEGCQNRLALAAGLNWLAAQIDRHKT